MLISYLVHRIPYYECKCFYRLSFNNSLDTELRWSDPVIGRTVPLISNWLSPIHHNLIGLYINYCIIDRLLLQNLPMHVMILQIC